jgi:molecular chaperone GrpE
MTDETTQQDHAEERPEVMDGEAVEAGATAAPPPTAEEHQELKDRLLRTLAEMENLRARTQREVEETRKFAVTGFARDLLEVGDNLGRALAAVPAEARQQSEFMKNLVQGVEMTQRSLVAALDRHQVRRVSPQKGERFDHKVHQAMFEVPTAELAPGSVAEVIQDGYVIADRLLRPALVGVAKAAAEAQPPRGAAIDTSA